MVEDRGPLLEGAIGGNDQRPLFIAQAPSGFILRVSLLVTHNISLWAMGRSRATWMPHCHGAPVGKRPESFMGVALPNILPHACLLALRVAPHPYGAMAP